MYKKRKKLAAAVVADKRLSYNFNLNNILVNINLYLFIVIIIAFFIILNIIIDFHNKYPKHIFNIHYHNNHPFKAFRVLQLKYHFFMSIII